MQELVLKGSAYSSKEQLTESLAFEGGKIRLLNCEGLNGVKEIRVKRAKEDQEMTVIKGKQKINVIG